VGTYTRPFVVELGSIISRLGVVTILLRSDELRFNNCWRNRTEIDSVDIVPSAVAAFGMVAGPTNTWEVHHVALVAFAEEEEKPSRLFIGLADPNLLN
jgi:hypothetical protein